MELGHERALQLNRLVSKLAQMSELECFLPVSSRVPAAGEVPHEEQLSKAATSGHGLSNLQVTPWKRRPTQQQVQLLLVPRHIWAH